MKLKNNRIRFSTLFICPIESLSPIITAFLQAREAKTWETRASRVTVPIGLSLIMNINS
jgi:hypothetical protein